MLSKRISAKDSKKKIKEISDICTCNNWSKIVFKV